MNYRKEDVSGCNTNYGITNELNTSTTSEDESMIVDNKVTIIKDRSVSEYHFKNETIVMNDYEYLFCIFNKESRIKAKIYYIGNEKKFLLIKYKN